MRRPWRPFASASMGCRWQIELTAARVKLLPPRALLRRLEDRLALLTGGPRDLPEHHQTLRAAIDWTHRLLDVRQQQALYCLVLFQGGFDLAAAHAVVGPHAPWLLDALQALLDSGLLVVDAAASEPRYRMLETVRAYAAEMLANSGDAEIVRQRYADYFVHTGAH